MTYHLPGAERYGATIPKVWLSRTDAADRVGFGGGVNQGSWTESI